MEAILNEMKARIEGIERQVGILPKPWETKKEPVLKPTLKKPAAKKK